MRTDCSPPPACILIAQPAQVQKGYHSVYTQFQSSGYPIDATRKTYHLYFPSRLKAKIALSDLAFASLFSNGDSTISLAISSTGSKTIMDAGTTVLLLVLAASLLAIVAIFGCLYYCFWRDWQERYTNQVECGGRRRRRRQRRDCDVEKGATSSGESSCWSETLSSIGG